MSTLEIIAAASVLSGVVSAAMIAIDLRHRPQTMKIMNSVWILTGLWAGVFSLPAYFGFGRSSEQTINGENKTDGQSRPTAGNRDMGSMAKTGNTKSGGTGTMAKMNTGNSVDNMTDRAGMMNMETGAMAETSEMGMDDKNNGMVISGETMNTKTNGMTAMPKINIGTGNMNGSGGVMNINGEDMATMPAMNIGAMGRGGLRSVALSTLHCGAGCTLADIVGEWLLYLIPITVGGSVIFGGWIADYILALCFGVYFQYAAIRNMHKISKNDAVKHALKADILSLTAWQVGMYGWMAIALFGVFGGESLAKTSWTFWFMMQAAMMAGFVCAMPVNALLIKWKIKSGM